MATIHVDNSGSNTSPYDTFAKAANLLQTALTLWTQSDGTIFMAAGHNESNAGLLTLTCSNSTTASKVEVKRVSTSDFSYSGTPSSFNIQAGAGGDIFFDLNAVFHGIYFDTQDDMFGANGKVTHLIDCFLQIDDDFSINNNFADGLTRLDNVDILFEEASARFLVATGHFIMSGGSIDHTVAGAVILEMTASKYALSEFIAVDLSTAGPKLTNIFGDTAIDVHFIRCLLPSSYVINSGTYGGDHQNVFIWSSDDAGVDHVVAKENYRGLVDQDDALFLTSGFDFEGTDELSMRMAPVTVTDEASPLESIAFYIDFDGTVNTATTFTVEILDEHATQLTDKNCWLEIYYPGSSSTTLWTRITTRNNDGDNADLGTTLAAGTGTGNWTGTTTGYTSRKVAITTDGSAIPHVQKKGLMKAILYVGYFESGKDMLYNPQLVVS